MATFYVKPGFGSISFNGKIYNDGDKIELKGKETNGLEDLITKSKPNTAEEEPKTAPSEDLPADTADNDQAAADADLNASDVPETADPESLDSPEGSEADESIILELEDGEKIDLATVDFETLKNIATSNEIEFAGNIGEAKLRARVTEHFIK